MTLSVNGRAALAYAERFGFYVLPLREGTKRPEWFPGTMEHGHKQATNDPAIIAEWWTKKPHASVGVNCSLSRLVVLDADLYKDDCEFPELEARLGRLPTTPTVLSPSGGVHYYFKDTVGHYRGVPCAGCECKYNGLTVLPPSVHANGKRYAWDVGAHILDTPLAELPDAWLAFLTDAATPVATRPSSGADAADSYLGHAFAALGWLGDLLPDGRRMVRCPWVHEHSEGRGDGNDSSTVIFPRAVGATLGGFQCSHGHCQNAGRTWKDVLAVLPVEVKRIAELATVKTRNRAVYERLGASHG